MKTILKENDGRHIIIIQNIERAPEEPVFKAIVEAMKHDSRTVITDTIAGPSEDVVLVNCADGNVKISYDLDYGLDYIECSDSNILIIKNIVDEVLNTFKSA